MLVNSRDAPANLPRPIRGSGLPTLSPNTLLDVMRSHLCAQLKRRPLGCERLETRRVLAAYINEFHFDSLLDSMKQDQYVEIRGESNATLADGTYFIGIESADGVHELGDIHTIIDLSGQRLGANGILVLLPSGSGYTIDAAAAALSGTDGFQGLGGSLFQADNDANNIHAGSGTFLLIQSAVAPTLADDIDADDDGTPEGVYTNWSVLDGFTTLPWVESVWNQRAYADIVFQESGVGDGFLPGSTLIETDQLSYAGRIANSTGYSKNDWVAGSTVEKTSEPWQFQLQHGVLGTPRPYAYGGRVLDHVGSINWHGEIQGTTFQDLNSDGVQQAGEPAIAGVAVRADYNGLLNGHYWETIEPNNYAVGDDMSNVSDNVTLVSAGADNVHQGFKARAVQRAFATTGEHIFAHEGVGFWNENRRLRMDFYRPARSVRINVIGNSDTQATYGRLEIFNASGESLAFVRSVPLGAGDVQTLELSSANDDIAWALAYSEDSHLDSSPFGMLDHLQIQMPPAATTSDANGNYRIVPMTEADYTVSAPNPQGYFQVFPQHGAGHQISLTNSQVASGLNFGFSNFEPPAFNDQTVSSGELIAADETMATLPVILGYPTQQLQFTILSGDPNHQFRIHDATRQLISTRGDFDYETLSSYSLQIEVRDANINAFFDTAVVTVNITDQNDAPNVIAAETSVDENAANDTPIHTMSGSDQDTGAAGTLTWKIINGNIGDTFAIDSSTGSIRVADRTELDYETNPAFDLLVRATDGGSPTQFAEALLKVHLNDLNESPQIPPQSFDVDENSSATLVGQLLADEADAGQTVTWSVLGGDGMNLFDVDSDGRIHVATGASLNFESKSSYVLQVQAADSGAPPLTAVRTVSIQINDINDPPTIAPQQFTLFENSAAGTPVGSIAANDEDVGQAPTFSIVSGPFANSFDIDATSGLLTVAENATLDFESNPMPELVVQVTDSHSTPSSASASITISLGNVNEAPQLATQSFSVPENSSVGTVIGTVEASDPDAGDTLEYSLVDQSLPWIEVDAETGQVTVGPDAEINFEEQNSAVATVRVTDSQGLHTEAEIPLFANDANDAPTLARPLADVMAEAGMPFSAILPEDSFTDEDVNDSLRYVATTENGFALPTWLQFNPATRELTGTPNSNHIGNYKIKISAVDNAGQSASDVFELEVIDQVNSWHNQDMPLDASGDGFVSPIDALMVINFLNAGNSSAVPRNAPPNSGFVDVNGDDFVTPIDALIVINHLNNANGEGESSNSNRAAGWDHAPVDAPRKRLQTTPRPDSQDTLLALLAYDRHRRLS